MKYSVVMPVYLRSAAHMPILEQTIESVKANSKDYEFIIVDDGSPLPTGIVRREADKYIRQENKGIAPSWNVGKNKARGEYVAIINDDIRVPNYWLESMSDVFEDNPDCGVVGTMFAGPNVTPELLATSPNLDHKWFSGYCFMLKKDKFFEDFDEQFVPFNFEDIDYWERIQKADLNMYKAPLAIWHAEGNVIHELNYQEQDNINLQKFIKKWGFNPKEKYFG